MAEEFENIDFEVDTSLPDNLPAADYAQVVFHNIAEFYPLDASVACKYTVTASMQPSNRDWIGVYKVGWTSSKDHYYYEWAPLPTDYETGKQFEGIINFKANSLPKDDGEFYQFCYVTSNGHVRGASTPFQFRGPHADDFVEVEDLDDDIMVIKSKKTALADQLGHVTKEREVLAKNKELLECERESLLSKLLSTQKRVDEEQRNHSVVIRQLESSNDRIEQLNQEAKDMLLVHDGLRDKITRLNEEKLALSKLLEEKDTDIRNVQKKMKFLINEKDSFMGKNKMLEEEKDLYKSHFTSSESTLQGHVKEIENLKKQLEGEESARGELEQTVVERDRQIEQLQVQLHDHNAALGAEKENVECLLKEAEEKIATLDRNIVTMNTQVDALTLAYTEVSDKYERSKVEADSLESKVSLLEEVNERQAVKMGEQIQELNIKLKHATQHNQQLSRESEEMKLTVKTMSEQKSEQQDGALFALHTAHHSLKHRLQKSEKHRRDLEKDMEELLRKKNARDVQVEDMKKEIKDLKDRLQMGQDEYKQKYIECRKLHQDYRKLHRQLSNRKNSDGPEKQTEASVTASGAQVKPSTGNKHTETDEDVADLTNHELQMQLDDLGKELEYRSVKKQKYKEQYQREREKSTYLQKHYFEELEKKDSEIKTLQQTVKEKQSEIHGLQEIIKEKNRSMEQSEQQQCPRVSPNVLYPPQQSPQKAAVTPVLAPQYEAPSQVEYPAQAAVITAKSGGELLLPRPLTPEQTADCKLTTVLSYMQNGTNKTLNGLESPKKEAAEGLPETAEAQLEELVACGEVNAEGAVVNQPSPRSVDCDEAEERFFDAPETKECPVCHMTFPLHIADMVLLDHIEQHFTKTKDCPVCDKKFSSNTDHSEFEKHVQQHFTADHSDGGVQV